MGDSAAVAQLLASFITTELIEDLDQVEMDDNLLADGMVDSLGMVRLVGYIEQEFGYSVPPEDFIVANFQTLESICAYLSNIQGS